MLDLTDRVGRGLHRQESGLNDEKKPLVAKVVIGCLLGVLVLGSWSLWATRNSGESALGSKGQVVAVVGDACSRLRIEVDDLYFEGEAPTAWRLQTRSGELSVTGRYMEDGRETLSAIFTDSDGTEVPVIGGLRGEVFFPLGCGMGGVTVGS